MPELDQPAQNTQGGCRGGLNQARLRRQFLRERHTDPAAVAIVASLLDALPHLTQPAGCRTRGKGPEPRDEQPANTHRQPGPAGLVP